MHGVSVGSLAPLLREEGAGGRRPPSLLNNKRTPMRSIGYGERLPRQIRKKKVRGSVPLTGLLRNPFPRKRGSKKDRYSITLSAWPA
jgi:hypothetical protein